MDPPTNGAQLQQFVCAMQWMRNVIQKFAEIVKPLLEFLEIVFQKTCKRTTRSAASVKLVKIGWSETQLDAFGNCKRTLEHQLTLAHRDFDKILCVYTDVCDTVWSAIITQFLSLIHI